MEGGREGEKEGRSVSLVAVKGMNLSKSETEGKLRAGIFQMK